LWLDQGQILINRRCRYLWSCVENWEWALPAGVLPHKADKARVGPRKDVYSHGADALMYLVAGTVSVLDAHRRRAADSRPQPETRRRDDLHVVSSAYRATQAARAEW
jgi:hypothetical protein